MGRLKYCLALFVTTVLLAPSSSSAGHGVGINCAGGASCRNNRGVPPGAIIQSSPVPGTYVLPDPKILSSWLISRGLLPERSSSTNGFGSSSSSRAKPWSMFSSMPAWLLKPKRGGDPNSSSNNKNVALSPFSPKKPSQEQLTSADYLPIIPKSSTRSTSISSRSQHKSKKSKIPEALKGQERTLDDPDNKYEAYAAYYGLPYKGEDRDRPKGSKGKKSSASSSSSSSSPLQSSYSSQPKRRRQSKPKRSKAKKNKGGGGGVGDRRLTRNPEYSVKKGCEENESNESKKACKHNHGYYDSHGQGFFLSDQDKLYEPEELKEVEVHAGEDDEALPRPVPNRNQGGYKLSSKKRRRQQQQQQQQQQHRRRVQQKKNNKRKRPSPDEDDDDDNESPKNNRGPSGLDPDDDITRPQPQNRGPPKKRWQWKPVQDEEGPYIWGEDGKPFIRVVRKPERPTNRPELLPIIPPPPQGNPPPHLE